MDREEIIKLAREVGYPLVEYEGAPYIPPLLAVLLKAVATPRRPWVGLTDEEIGQGCKESWVTEQAWQSAVWWAEARLKEKNNG